MIGAALLCAIAYCPGYSQQTISIPDADTFATWTVIDANNDTYTWVYNSEDAYYKQNKSSAANDWLISPAVHLEGGKTYQVSAYVKNASTFSSDKHDFTITGGAAATVAGQTSTILTVTSYQTKSYTEKSGKFVANESGDYYFGVHVTSKAYQGDFGFQKFVIQEVKTYPGAVTNGSATVAPNGEMSVSLSWTWPSKNNDGGTLSAITGAKIYRGSSSSFAMTDQSLVATLEQGFTPGAEASYVDQSMTTPGVYYYKVVPCNENGDSPSTVTAIATKWVGEDTSLATITNVVAKAVEGNEKAVSLTFDTPVGANGGYVNPANIVYKITRQAGSATAETIETEWTGTQPYVDTTIPGLNSYVYTVTPIYKGSSSVSGGKSNAIVVGGALSLPYSQTFNTTTSADLFTKFHLDPGTKDWSCTAKGLDYWGSGTANAWICTPYIEFEAGKAYEISLSAYISKSGSNKDLYIYYGSAANAESLQDNQIFHETVTNTTAAVKTATFSVPASGRYVVALRCYGTSDYNDLYIQSMDIKAIEVAPAPVSELAATPGADGALSVSLAWTNPAKTNAGGDLASLTKVEVSRGTEVVGVLENTTPGAKVEWTDNAITAPGKYSYSVVVYVGDKTSESVSASTAWVGYDVPKAPAKVSVALGDNGERIVTFDAVTEGVNGGYINAEALKYVVSRNEDVINSAVEESPYTDYEDYLPLAKYAYSVKAVNGEYAGAATTSSQIIFGMPLALPYHPDFATQSSFDLWTFKNSDASKTYSWSYNSTKKALSAGSNTVWAYTPPLTLVPGMLKVTFKAMTYSSRYTEDMDIYLCKTNNPSDADTNKLIASNHITAYSSPADVTVEMPVEDNGTYYVAFYVASPNMYVYLTDCNIEEDVQTSVSDLSVDGVKIVDGHMVVPAGATVELYNLNGVKVASDSNVSVLVPGIYVARVTMADGRQVNVKVRR